MQITIKYVNAPREGKKFGSIKTPDGQTFWVPGALINEFSPGTTVDVPIQDAKWGANLVKVVAGSPSGDATPAPQAERGSWSPPRASVPAAPSQPAAGNMDRKDALIFVTGVVGRAMGSGQFKSGDVSDLTHEALKAWFMLKDQLK